MVKFFKTLWSYVRMTLLACLFFMKPSSGQMAANFLTDWSTSNAQNFINDLKILKTFYLFRNRSKCLWYCYWLFFKKTVFWISQLLNYKWSKLRLLTFFVFFFRNCSECLWYCYWLFSEKTVFWFSDCKITIDPS